MSQASQHLLILTLAKFLFFFCLILDPLFFLFPYNTAPVGLGDYVLLFDGLCVCVCGGGGGGGICETEMHE